MKSMDLIIKTAATYVPFLGAMAAIAFLTGISSTISALEWIYLIVIGSVIIGGIYWSLDLDVENQREELFQRFDTNHDGYISRAEVAGARDLALVFDQADEDHDGRLSRREFAEALDVCDWVADRETRPV